MHLVLFIVLGICLGVVGWLKLFFIAYPSRQSIAAWVWQEGNAIYRKRRG